jgi:hypothetical protein
MSGVHKMTEFSHITIRLTPEQFAWLAERKKSTGTTFASQLRLLIEDARRLEQDLADIAARKPQHDAAILALLEKEPELAVHFPGYLPEQKADATGSGGREFVSSTVSQEQLDAEIAKGV